jgi:hypothetical protein
MSDGLKLLGGSDRYTGLYLVGIEEWSQFFGHCNWYTFHPIKIEVEDDLIMGGVEATFILLGLGFRVRLNYARTEQVNQITDSVEQVMKDLDLT